MRLVGLQADVAILAITSSSADAPPWPPLSGPEVTLDSNGFFFFFIIAKATSAMSPWLPSSTAVLENACFKALTLPIGYLHMLLDLPRLVLLVLILLLPVMKNLDEDSFLAKTVVGEGEGIGDEDVREDADRFEGGTRLEDLLIFWLMVPKVGDWWCPAKADW